MDWKRDASVRAACELQEIPLSGAIKEKMQRDVWKLYSRKLVCRTEVDNLAELRSVVGNLCLGDFHLATASAPRAGKKRNHRPATQITEVCPRPNRRV